MMIDIISTFSLYGQDGSLQFAMLYIDVRYHVLYKKVCESQNIISHPVVVWDNRTDNQGFSDQIDDQKNL